MTNNHRPYHFKDRELSKAEKAVIVGFHRQGARELEIMGVLELRAETIRGVLNNYFGKKLKTSNP